MRISTHACSYACTRAHVQILNVFVLPPSLSFGRWVAGWLLNGRKNMPGCVWAEITVQDPIFYPLTKGNTLSAPATEPGVLGRKAASRLLFCAWFAAGCACHTDNKKGKNAYPKKSEIIDSRQLYGKRWMLLLFVSFFFFCTVWLTRLNVNE